MIFTIISPNVTTPTDVETSARTWGELKVDLKKAGISTSNMIGVIKSTHTNLELDSALLPSTNAKEVLFLFQQTMKSGGAKSTETTEEYNARRRREYAAKKKATPAKKAAPVKKVVAKKAAPALVKKTTVTKKVTPVAQESADVKEVIELLRSTRESIAGGIGNLEQIEVLINNLKISSPDNSAELMKEWDELRKLLAPLHNWK